MGSIAAIVPLITKIDLSDQYLNAVPVIGGRRVGSTTTVGAGGGGVQAGGSGLVNAGSAGSASPTPPSGSSGASGGTGGSGGSGGSGSTGGSGGVVPDTFDPGSTDWGSSGFGDSGWGTGGGMGGGLGEQGAGEEQYEVLGKDEFGCPIYGYDENGKPLYGIDQFGNIITDPTLLPCGMKGRDGAKPGATANKKDNTMLFVGLGILAVGAYLLLKK